ncbi:hypothetical protein A3H85_01290 [Candidatus Daviesbacteria bacterium RIFCSPLOWO2_02_FULL_40_8]|uniref:Uncharacterized protein n=1 Tax=Candidatus Daviesbacteria bacterium RIFCSPLOWO2_01_FULL_40_24 TaxID=1797787 RepID=A0A1F5MKA0_9BACT|nr:MAG: hypothetical protein A2780_01845 [Candidatus Daviesbacteria bacterium RIFCSPHIGHO2_01_FULL_41_45]OGE34119.1 MAG: hypothetical protein A3C32_00810 [Candidatus Daviesbacteria bacterium RIFCSPHIGHO2_02_FULL_41_14]OGE65801.1 MAG: hypothetical protein A3B49_03315 [Candidatus Daviesbacteria bacterium RIFCSPLOWO2_01_FULL_40_24]OGE66918.1 MAG: hypothetical protein A3H85_01290 [Candidatus Daviesbacteria bacterium RIFCSPLOWO2_02_FULL_40_8]
MGPPPSGIVQLQDLLTRVISLSVGLAFVALLIMLVVGGIRMILSGGDAKGLQGAQQTLTWAVVGMILLVLAWLVLKLISSFTGVDVTQFCIGFAPNCL